MWKLPYEPLADYAPFKSVLYAQIDPRIGEFFVPGARSLIRLDEVVLTLRLEAAKTRFRRRLPGRHVADGRGRKWRVTEEALVPDGHHEVPKPRLPAWRAFWFGWYAQFPDTTLIK